MRACNLGSAAGHRVAGASSVEDDAIVVVVPSAIRSLSCGVARNLLVGRDVPGAVLIAVDRDAGGVAVGDQSLWDRCKSVCSPASA